MNKKVSEKDKKNWQNFISNKEKLIKFKKTSPNVDALTKALKKLDDILISYKALPYIVKDSRLTKEVVEQCYPEYHVFKEILNEIDPKRIFKSELSERLNL